MSQGACRILSIQGVVVWVLGGGGSAPDFRVTYSGALQLKAEAKDAHSDVIYSVAFSPDGKTIVSGSRDKTIKVWDAGGFFNF